jgi:hypothetical protein
LIHPTDAFVYLQDSGVTLDGVSFWGTPWTIPFHGWGFNAREEVRELAFSQIPEGVDVLLTHGPPKVGGLGYLEDKQLGDPVLDWHICRAKPKLVFCGHIHYSSGRSAEIIHEDKKITKMFNVAYLGEDYLRVPDGGYTITEV